MHAGIRGLFGWEIGAVSDRELRFFVLKFWILKWDFLNEILGTILWGSIW